MGEPLGRENVGLSAPVPLAAARKALPALAAIGALVVGLYLALIVSPAPADARVRRGADAMAFLGQAWMLENGQVAYRDFSAAWGPVPQALARMAVALGPGSYLESGPMVYFVLRAVGVVALVAWVFWLPLQNSGWYLVPLVAFGWTLQSSSHAVFRVGIALIALRAAAWALAAQAGQVPWRRVPVAAVAMVVTALCSFDVFVYAMLALAFGSAMLALRGGVSERAPTLRSAGAIGFATFIGFAVMSAVATVTAADRSQGLLEPLERVSSRASTFSQVFGLPVESGWAGILAWSALAVVAVAGSWRSAVRADDPLRLDLALLAPFALFGLKSSVTRGDLSHVAFGLTGVLALLALLPAGRIRQTRERTVLLAVLAAALALWPASTLASGLPTHETADPLRAWRRLVEPGIDPGLLPQELFSTAAGRPGPLFVFPLQVGFAAAVERRLVAPVDQAYGAHTLDMQADVVEALRAAGPDLEVIYGLDGLPTWRVDGVQSISRSPVLVEYLLTEFRPEPERVLDGGYLLLRRRDSPRSLSWRRLPLREVSGGRSISVDFDRPERCPLLRLELELDYPRLAKLTWAAGVRVRGESAGEPVLSSRLVAVEAGRPFSTYLSPLSGASFAALFGDVPTSAAPPLDRLVLEAEDPGPFGVRPRRIRVAGVACLVGAKDSA